MIGNSFTYPLQCSVNLSLLGPVMSASPAALALPENSSIYYRTGGGFVTTFLFAYYGEKIGGILNTVKF